MWVSELYLARFLLRNKLVVFGRFSELPLRRRKVAGAKNFPFRVFLGQQWDSTYNFWLNVAARGPGQFTEY